MLRYLRCHIDSHGVAPSFREIRFDLGFGSKSQVHRIVTALEERGHIRRSPRQARAITLL